MRRLGNVLAPGLLVLSSLGGAAMSDELATGLVRCRVPQWHVATSLSDARPGMGWFDRPIAQADSPMAIVEYVSENGLRSERAGELVADVESSSVTSAMVVPFRSRGSSTKLALSHRDERLAIFTNDKPSTRSDLRWVNQADTWRLSETAGKWDLEVSGSDETGRLSGTSAYPPRAFHALGGDADVVSDRVYQGLRVCVGARPSRRTLVRLGVGSLALSNNLRMARENTSVSLPLEMRLRSFDVTLLKQVGRHLSLSIDGLVSDGESADHIYLNDRSVGKMEYDMRGRMFGLSLCRNRGNDRVFYGGWATRRGALGLAGIGLSGQQLGIATKPWNEKIDFEARAVTAANTYYVGYERRASPMWTWSVLYRLSYLKQDLTGDYVGRTFFGLLSVQGDYTDELPDYALHGLELSAAYSRERFSLVVGLEQIVPEVSNSGKAADRTRGEDSTAPKIKTKSAGGLCFSLSCAYSL